MSFAVTELVFGQPVEVELKPGGKNVPVTEKNKKVSGWDRCAYKIESFGSVICVLRLGRITSILSCGGDWSAA